jgi:hypothetical protein
MPDEHTTRFAMAQGLQMRCHCCGAEFIAFNSSARWCSSRCAMRAYYRRRNGKPEADPRYQSRVAHQQALQTALVVADNSDTLPAAWADTEAPQGMEQRFWRGVPISRRESDGFVNATAMAKANGKHLPHYMANERTREYIAALAPVVGIPTTALIHTIQGGTPALQGTWIHPRLAVDLARWISPAFAVWMDGWFLESLQRLTRHSLPTGVHVVAESPEQAKWLWMDAVWRHTVQLSPPQLQAVFTFTPKSA